MACKKGLRTCVSFVGSIFQALPGAVRTSELLTLICEPMRMHHEDYLSAPFHFSQQSMAFGTVLSEIVPIFESTAFWKGPSNRNSAVLPACGLRTQMADLQPRSTETRLRRRRWIPTL